MRIRPWHIIVFIVLAAGAGTVAFKNETSITPPVTPITVTPIPTNATSTPTCDASLWDHVYHPARLKVLETCKSITGTLINFVKEKDGDFHGRLDVSDKSLINADNIKGQHGYLVIEGICQYPVTQADAIDSCSNFNAPKFDLQSMLGRKITVTGSYVQDTEHNQGVSGWLELHPVSKIEVVN